MRPKDEKKRTHVAPTKGALLGQYLSSLVVVASILLLSGALCADDTIPDSTLPSFASLVERPEKPSDERSHYSYGLSGLATIGSKEISNGFGFGFIGFFDGFLPLVPRAGLDVVISSLDVEGLPNADFITFSPTLGFALRGSVGRLHPYAGIGINLHSSHLSLDEPADVSMSGYDTTTQARQIDMGWGVTPHLRLGLIIPVGEELGVFVESRFMRASHTADMNYRDRFTGDEWKGTVDYNMPSVWFSLGIIHTP